MRYIGFIFLVPSLSIISGCSSTTRIDLGEIGCLFPDTRQFNGYRIENEARATDYGGPMILFADWSLGGKAPSFLFEVHVKNPDQLDEYIKKQPDIKITFSDKSKISYVINIKDRLDINPVLLDVFQLGEFKRIALFSYRCDGSDIRHSYLFNTLNVRIRDFNK